MDKKLLSHQRHMQWLVYYNTVVEKYRKLYPEIFHKLSNTIFYEEVADHFGYETGTVYRVIRKLIKNSNTK